MFEDSKDCIYLCESLKFNISGVPWYLEYFYEPVQTKRNNVTTFQNGTLTLNLETTFYKLDSI